MAQGGEEGEMDGEEAGKGGEGREWHYRRRQSLMRRLQRRQ